MILITDSCIGCGECKDVCPVECISGEAGAMHVIDQDTCISCAACVATCPVGAIIEE